MYKKMLNDTAPDYSGPLTQISEEDVILPINKEIANPKKFLPIKVKRQKAIDEIIDCLLPKAKRHLANQ